jgi:hypothetical protein
MEREEICRPPARLRAYVQPMASATLRFPYLDISTVPSGGNSLCFGDVVASTETEPGFNKAS